MKQILYIIVAAISVALPVSADTLSSAAAAYRDGRYAEAARIYEQVVAEKGTSAQLLCNLGNAYVKAGDYGHAMLAYSRARKIDPSDSEVRDNIRYVQSKVADNNAAELKGKKLSVEADDASFLSAVGNSFTQGVSSDVWAVWSAILFVLFIGCLATYLFTRTVILRKIGFFGGIVTVALSIIFLLLSFASASAANSRDRGVVLGYKVPLRTEPELSSKASPYPLTRGTVMSVLDSVSGDAERGKWYKVRLNSDYVGWISATDFEIF